MKCFMLICDQDRDIQALWRASHQGFIQKTKTGACVASLGPFASVHLLYHPCRTNEQPAQSPAGKNGKARNIWNKHKRRKKSKDTILGAKASKIGTEPSGRIPLVGRTCGWALGISFCTSKCPKRPPHGWYVRASAQAKKINVFLFFFYSFFFSSKTLSASWVETRSVFRPQSLGGGQVQLVIVF